MRRNAEIQERQHNTDTSNGRKNHRIKDMSIKQERKDDRKNEGQKYIHSVGRLQNLNLSSIFRIGGPGNLESFLNFQDKGGLGT